LLDELPDEFLRRAVSSEHLFLQRAFQSEAADRQCAVLFDAGPDQLGAPRIAHLALLIVLAQRAAQNGATLRWGIFQDTSAVPYTGLDKSLILSLFAARSARPVTGEDINRWAAAMSGASELWFIGAEHLAAEALCHRASPLIVSEVMEPGAAARLRVTAPSPGTPAARAREALLDVPPADTAVRLLRDPFNAHVAARCRVSAPIGIRNNILFAPDGRRLYLRGADGSLVIIRVPNSPRDKSELDGGVHAPHAAIPAAERRRPMPSTVRRYADRSRRPNARPRRYLAPQPGTGAAAGAGNAAAQPAGSGLHAFCFAPHGHLVELTKDTFNIMQNVFAAASRAAVELPSSAT
jgi:hypothetical protein